MVLARSLEEWLERRRERHDAKLRAEVRAEERAKWRDKWREWNNRRIAAEKNNEPFDEPPPGAESQD